MEIGIRFDSDWHIGSGAGVPGQVDRGVLRDPEGLPLVPAKTLTGLLRDGCERVAQSLGEGWPALVVDLFGAQPHNTGGRRVHASPARLSIRPARLSDGLRGRFVDPVLRDALFAVTPHVQIDDVTGRAQDGHLFWMESVPAGAVLTAPMEVEGALGDHACALLFAGAAAVRRIGGKRRRGLGTCRVEIHGLPRPPAEGDWLDWLEHADAPQASQRAPAAPLRADADAVTGAWSVWDYVLEAKTPLCLPSRTVGNQGETLRHVPGTLLLPALATQLESQGLNVPSLIDGGALIVTHGWPGPIAAGSSGPVPLALQAPKASEGLARADAPVTNRLLADHPAGLRPPEPGTVPLALPKGKRPALSRVSVGVHLHNAVNDEKQRPDESVGGLYAVEALPVGTQLRGQVRLRAPAAVVLADGTVRLGRSKKDDFGSATIRFVPVVQTEDGPPAEPGSELRVWLLSDLLLRDEHLAWETRPEALATALGQALGVELEVKKAFVQPCRREGWVMRWDRPRPTLLGLAAGSSFSLRIVGKGPEGGLGEALARVMREGLGSRRAEGFGQMLIDPPVLCQPVPLGEAKTAGPPPTAGTAALPALTDSELGWLGRLERVAWRASIARAAVEAFHGGRCPWDWQRLTRSQLGTVRALFLRLEGARDYKDYQELVGWLHKLEEGPKRRARWPLRFRSWMKRLLEWPDAPAGLPARPANTGAQAMVWELLFLASADRPRFYANTEADKLRFWAEAVRICVRTAAALELDRREGGED